jgi:hypothetical protein
VAARKVPRVPGVSTQKSDRKINGKSLTNKISSQVNKWSSRIGYAQVLAPNAFEGLRGPRDAMLKINRHSRDLNSIMKGSVKNRVNNRIKGRVGGLLVNAVLPNFNNLFLRFARAKIGSAMNKALHKKTQNLNVLEMFGGKATRSVTKNFYGTGERGLGAQMQNVLAITVQALAPRTEFSMNIDGTVVEFGPNNLAMSVHKLPVDIKPDPYTLARYTVTVGGTTGDSAVADKAPYVWIANYGGMLFNPEDHTKPKKYAPTFFAERSLEFLGRMYKPVIKDLAAFIIKDNPKFEGKGIDESKLLKIEYGATNKRLQKIWLSKDAEAVKKEIESEGKGRRESVRYNNDLKNDDAFTDYYRKRGAHYLSDDGTMSAEAIDIGAENAMRILYGDEYVKRTVNRRPLKKDGSEDRRYKKREETIEVPLRITAGTGRVPITANMREMIYDKDAGRYVSMGEYADTYIEPGKIVGRPQAGKLQLGNVVFGEREMKILGPYIKDGHIKVVKDGKTGAIELQIVDKADEIIKDLDLKGTGESLSGSAQIKNLESQSGTTLKNWWEEKGVVTKANEMDFQLEGEKAVKKLLEDVDKGLRTSTSDRIVQITGKKAPTNQQLINSITDPELKSQVKNQLVKKGQRGFSTSTPFDPDKLSDDLKARLGFYTPAQIKMANVTSGNLGVNDVVSGDYKYLSQLNKEEISIKNDIASAKAAVRSAEDSLSDKGVRKAHSTNYGSAGRAAREERTIYKYDEKGIDEETRLMLGRKERIAIPTDPKAKPVIWETSTRVAKHDYYHPGFGVVLQGHKIPLNPTRRSIDAVSNINKYGIDSKARARDIYSGKSAVRRAERKVEALENRLKTIQAEKESVSIRTNALDSLTRPQMVNGKYQQSKIATAFQKGQQSARESFVEENIELPSFLAGNKKVNAESGFFIQKSSLLKPQKVSGSPAIGISNPENFAKYEEAFKSGDVTNLTFTFKKGIDSGELRSRGIMAFDARLHAPRLGGGHKSNSKKLTPIVSTRQKGSHTTVTDLTYKSDIFPTGKLVLSQEFNRVTHSSGQPTVKFRGQSGSTILPLTRNRVRPEQMGPVQGVFEEIAMFMNAKDVGEQPEGVEIGGWKSTTTLGGGVIIRFEDR